MSFKGVIFDLDGTLVNSIEDLADSMNIVLNSHDFPTHELESYKYFVGKGIRNLISNALPKTHQDKSLIDSCFEMMLEVYRANCVNKTKIYKGIPELLDELTLRNIRMAVFSNKADEFTKRIVDSLLEKWNFESIIGFTTEELRKPNPEIAIRISKNFGISSSEILYVGDSGVDMQTANNAGMSAVGVTWGFRTEQELVETGAKFILHHPLDLLKILS